MKNGLFWACTVALLSLLSTLSQSAEVNTPLPVAIAETDAFELVGRLETEGFVIFVDRAATNAPVLNATLEAELDGQKADARFRPEQGDYLIDDANWLKPLRQPGKYALAFTLIAGDEADLLSTDFDVSSPSTVAVQSPIAGVGVFGWGAGVLLLVTIGFGLKRHQARKRGAV